MLFSVVIPTFNRMQFLPAALASLDAQRFTDYETIVVDDGSTDGTEAYLATMGDRVRAIRQLNAGPGAARNAGVAAARGEYLAFLDSDDVWLPWTLELMARVISERTPSMIAGFAQDVRDASEAAAIHERPLAYRYFDDYIASSAYPVSVGACTVAMTRASFMAGGGFTTKRINAEDNDLALRLGANAGFVQITQPVTVAWRRHPVSETADLGRSVAGVSYLIEQERAGRYPGGVVRADDRRRIIARHARPISLACLRYGQPAAGLQMYRSTFAWNAGAGHWAYLAAFPIMGAWSTVRGKTT